MLPSLLLALALGQASTPYVRSRVTQGDTSTQCLYWTASRITWQQSSVGNPQTAGDGELEAVRRSFQSWQDVFTSCGNLTLAEGPVVDERKAGYEVGGENRNLVLFRARRCADVAPRDSACWKDEDCGNEFDCWEHGDGTIGIALTTYDERSGIIYDSDIELNASAFTFTTVDGAPCGPFATANCVSTDVQNTVTHEVGHLLGLDHINLSTSTMYPRAPPGETSKRLIDSGSREFICAAYPRGRPSQACLYPLAGQELGKKASGCSAGGAGAWGPSLALAALLALLRRRGGARG